MRVKPSTVYEIGMLLSVCGIVVGVNYDIGTMPIISAIFLVYFGIKWLFTLA